jgi:glutathione S-transferase
MRVSYNYFLQVDSSAIAEYLNKTFPEPAMKFSSAEVEAADEATKGIFPAMAKLNKVRPCDNRYRQSNNLFKNSASLRQYNAVLG